MAAVSSKVLVCVSWLGEEVCGKASTLKRHTGVKERDVLVRPFGCEFDGRVSLVQFLHKRLQVSLPMAPDCKNVIDVSPPDQRLEGGNLLQRLFTEFLMVYDALIQMSSRNSVKRCVWFAPY